MTSMKLHNILYLTLCLPLFFASCDNEDDEWERTIYVPDPNDEELPAYTELGYNSFGAKYDRNYFAVNSGIEPCQFILTADGDVNFVLKGMVSDYGMDNGYYSLSEKKMELSFRWKTTDKIKTYQDLFLLNKKEFDLTDGTCQVFMTLNDSVSTEIKPDAGSLIFSRAQLVFIDKKIKTAIVSGYFSMKYLDVDKDEIHNIKEGRFDLGVADRNFYYKE